MGQTSKLDINGNYPKADVLMSHFDKRTPHIIEIAKELKTVIPLRHPLLIAVSWKKRKQSGWLKEWMNMTLVEDAFYFPMETKPFDELEEYTGLELKRHDKMINSIGDYPERKDLQTARNFLQDTSDVDIALQTTIGRKFYATNICGV